MILAFLMLAIGCILLGGAWSLARQKKPILAVAALAIIGGICVIVSYWRITQGA